jgi:hypothetical protein
MSVEVSDEWRSNEMNGKRISVRLSSDQSDKKFKLIDDEIEPILIAGQ